MGFVVIPWTTTDHFLSRIAPDAPAHTHSVRHNYAIWQAFATQFSRWAMKNIFLLAFLLKHERQHGTCRDEKWKQVEGQNFESQWHLKRHTGDNSLFYWGRCICRNVWNGRGGGGGGITSWYPKFNGSHFDLPASFIHRVTGLGGNFLWTMSSVHRPHCHLSSLFVTQGVVHK